MLAKIGMALTFLLVCHGPVGAQAAPAPLAVVWQHFGLSLPAGYCVHYQQGPDFVVRYLRAGDSKGPILAGIYTGYAPNFSPDCKSATKRTWTSKSLKLSRSRDPIPVQSSSLAIPPLRIGVSFISGSDQTQRATPA